MDLEGYVSECPIEVCRDRDILSKCWLIRIFLTFFFFFFFFLARHRKGDTCSPMTFSVS